MRRHKLLPVHQTVLVMKLTLILLTAAFCTASANGLSQTVTFSSGNASVEEVISAVKQQTGYVFFYQKKTIKDARKINITAKNLPVKDFLSLAFKGQPFSWSIENQTIILEKASPPVVQLPPNIVTGGPNDPITIRLLDANGNPLSGASVSIKQSAATGVTNAEGVVKLNVSAGDVLHISFVGYEAKEIKITAENLKQGTLTTTLVLKQSILDDVVVIGYGTQRKSDVTGSLSRVTAETITERPVVNVAQALQGKASGLNVASNIKPGEVPSIRIRGSRSYNASNEPLYVVDGVPIVSTLGVTSFSINDLNPNDIASVEILKDASATAIYGSRGANGVILISTKRGAKGKMTLNFNSTVSLDSYHPMTDWMNAGQYIDRLRYALMNGRRYQPGSPSDLNTAPVIWYPDPHWDSVGFVASQITNNYGELLGAAMKGYEWNTDGTVKTRPATDAEKEMGWPDMVPSYNSGKIPTYDWEGAGKRTGLTQSHQIALSSGTEVTRLYMSLGYNKQLGVQRDQDFQRFNINVNGDITPVNWFSLGVSLIGSLSKQNFGINESK
jgi:TonB-dependent SusC/RagA subfamily outer membrane receptor